MHEIAEAVAAGDLSFLDERALGEWIVGQRWFGSKARDIAAFNVLEAVALREEPPLLVLALVEARFPVGTHEIYQVPLGLRPAQEGWQERVIAEAEGWTVYDALADAAHARTLLALMRESVHHAAAEGELRFCWAESAGGVEVGGEVRPMGVEQSNSSVVFGDRAVLKAFRRLEPGVNPELELLRFLSSRAFPSIAPLLGWYEYQGRLMDATLAILQEFLADGRDGWELALDDLEGFLGHTESLGRVTGELHSALGSDAQDPAFAPEEPSAEALSLLTADVDEQIERIFLDLPETDAVAPIAGRGQDVRERLAMLSNVGVGGRVIRTHGDYHLGQTMLTGRGWVVLDFEGEPARSLPERRQKRSPLRDVAGMLRSFSYASAGSELLRGRPAPSDWEQRARERYLAAYFEAVDPSLLPPGQDPTQKLLSVFELEKAVYELRYELNNRPDWVGIPVAGIARLLDTN
jgi:predicted trehalose synthase